MASQLSDDRCEGVGEVGADDHVGEADLLASSLEFLDCGWGFSGSTARESALRGAVVSGGAMKAATRSPTTDT